MNTNILKYCELGNGGRRVQGDKGSRRKKADSAAHVVDGRGCPLPGAGENCYLTIRRRLCRGSLRPMVREELDTLLAVRGCTHDFYSNQYDRLYVYSSIR